MERQSNFLLRSLLPIIALFALQNALSLMVTEMYVAVAAYHFTGDSLMDYIASIEGGVTDINIYTSFIYAIVGVILYAIWYSLRFYRTDSKHLEKAKVIEEGHGLTLSISHIRILPFIVALLLFAFGMQYLSNYIVSAVAMISPESIALYEQLSELSGLSGDSPLMIAYAVFLGPILEEIVFRGVTFEYARRSTGFVAANIIQAILFAGMHMNLVQASYAFIIGLVFGYVMQKTGNLALTCIMHIAYNGMSLVIATFLPELGTTPILFFLGLVISLTMFYLSVVCLGHSVRTETSKEEDKE